MRKLIMAIRTYGSNANGRYEIAFGDLNRKAAGQLDVGGWKMERGRILTCPPEALTGTLRTAKKQKIVAYSAEMLLAGAHDSVVISLLREDLADSALDTCG